jgi:hypothetical protein
MGNASKAKTARTRKQPARAKVARVPLRPARRQERSDGGDAFIPDPGDGPARTSDDLAELLAEDFVEAATRGNEVLEDELDRPLSDELGGPFIVTDPREELAEGTDDSNPLDADVEPLPRANAGLVTRPREEELDNELRDEDGADDFEADGDADVGIAGQQPPRRSQR